MWRGYQNGNRQLVDDIFSASSYRGNDLGYGDNCTLIEWHDLFNRDYHLTSVAPNASFEQASGSLILVGSARSLGVASTIIHTGSHQITGSGDFAIHLAAQTVNTSHTLSVTVRRLRLDYRRKDASVVSSSGGGGGSGLVPLLSLPFLAGVGTTNIAHTGSKLSLGMCRYNPTIVNSFFGTKTVWWRAIVDTTEPYVSASIDIYDISGIAYGVPGIISGSILSSSNVAVTELSVDLTSQLGAVTGSGILEARLWKEPAGTVTSSVSCHNARLDVEFT
jgi:hypothetical protein